MTDTQPPVTDPHVRQAQNLGDLMNAAAADPAIAKELNAAFGRGSNSPAVAVLAALVAACASRYGLALSPEVTGLVALGVSGAAGYLWSYISRGLDRGAIIAKGMGT